MVEKMFDNMGAQRSSESKRPGLSGEEEMAIRSWTKMVENGTDPKEAIKIFDEMKNLSPVAKKKFRGIVEGKMEKNPEQAVKETEDALGKQLELDESEAYQKLKSEFKLFGKFEEIVRDVLSSGGIFETVIKDEKAMRTAVEAIIKTRNSSENPISEEEARQAAEKRLAA